MLLPLLTIQGPEPSLALEYLGMLMRTSRTDLMQGTLELLILKTLSRDQMHGYGIAQRIHQSVDDLLKVEDGSLYPALYRMEERGWIASEWGVSENNRRAKFYQTNQVRTQTTFGAVGQLGARVAGGDESFGSNLR
jgi:PadR family transcriptional regulator, regulatory protein PadR